MQRQIKGDAEQTEKRGSRIKGFILKAGAIVSAILVAFCWQLGFILLGLGLGSTAMAVWMTVWLTKYRWVFIIATFVFLGGAFYQARRETSRWKKWILYGTTILSVGFILYALFYR